MSDKPRVLILGGSGFIGRHFVMYLFKHQLASKVCVADKVPPAIAGLSKAEMEVYNNKDFLVFKQIDLKVPSTVTALFDFDGGNYSYVFNLAAVHKYSQNKEIYDANIIELASVVSAEAAKRKVTRFVHVSTSQVYDGKAKKPCDENGKIKPWTGLASAHLAAEEKVRGTAGLNYVIVRPAITYGTGDTLGLTPRLVIGSVYKVSGDKMESLYDKGLRLNTVHADDVAKALWFLKDHGENGQTFNLADKNDTDQGKINELLEKIFGIRTTFLNAIKMKAASTMGTKFLVGFANDEHLKPFSDACKKYGILDTPLTPYLDEELIFDLDTAVDGSAIEKLGFSYDHPHVTVESLKEVLQDYITKGYFPKEMMG